MLRLCLSAVSLMDRFATGPVLDRLWLWWIDLDLSDFSIELAYFLSVFNLPASVCFASMALDELE